MVVSDGGSGVAVNAGAGLDTITESDVASPEPASLVAVMRQATERPRSAAVSVYVGVVAPAMTAPLRSHA